jgi:cardiolipin synthase
MSGASGNAYAWLRTGDEVFPAMIAAINAAKKTVRLESYIYSPADPGLQVCEALTRAAQRGVRVQALVDALGSYELPDNFWKPLRETGGEARFFNPLALKRFGIRNHRKLLVCDDGVAFMGGFNVASEYQGDGVTRGWRDLGLRIEGPMAVRLGASFDEMFRLADFQHKRFARFRKAKSTLTEAQAKETLLLCGPGRARNPMLRMLLKDLHHARNVQIVVAYFLPTRRLRRELGRVMAHRGGVVQLILPGKSDVAMSQLAGRSLYRRLLRRGIRVFEYQPQILHAKMFIVDDVVYVGSSNLDPRSLSINYELMLRLDDARLAQEARDIFGEMLKHCELVELDAWWKASSVWTRLKQRWAHFVLARIDPYIARRQWRALPD